jgi:hypothetical protein
MAKNLRNPQTLLIYPIFYWHIYCIISNRLQINFFYIHFYGGFMRPFVVALLCLALSGSIFASDWATSEGSCYGKGNLSVGGGLSIGWFGAFASADYGIHDAISIGGAVGYSGYGYGLGFGRVNFLPIYVRGAFHPFNLKVLSDKISIRDKLDPYAGIAAGYTAIWWSGSSFSSYDSPFSLLREYIGVKFYPKGKLYLLAEEAGGLSWINIGVGYKF